MQANVSRGSLLNTAGTENKFQHRRRLLWSTRWWLCHIWWPKRLNFRIADIAVFAVIIPDDTGTPDQFVRGQILVNHNLLQAMYDGHQLNVLR